MADNVVSDDSEKSLYLMQIQYLEEQLERSELKCDELEEQNKDLSSQYRALEKDKKDITDYLKRSLALKEKKLDELEEQLESQQRAAEQDRKTLNLQQRYQMQKLQEQISNLTLQSVTQAAKIEEQKAPPIQLKQQLQYVESLEKQLDSQDEEHQAAIHNLKIQAVLNKEKFLEAHHNKVNASIQLKISRILENERPQHRKHEEQVHFLHSDNARLKEENEAIRDKQRGLCVQRDDLQKDLKKIQQENITYRKQVKQLSDSCEQLRVEIKDCRTSHRHKVAHLKGLRRRVDPLVKECRERAEEANQPWPEIQEERTEQRRLERILQEAAIVLRHVLDSDKAFETQGKVQRLFEILESTAAQGTASTVSKSPEKKVRGQKPQTSSLKSARKLPSDLAPQLTYSEADAPTSAGH